MTELSKSKIDRLGDRLRKGAADEADLRLLDEYRRSFGEAYNEVVRILREQNLSPTGRSAKSTMSIADKLRRESIRLSQMQDVAGCRIVVEDVVEQDRVVGVLTSVLPSAAVIDRRENPSHGYRAVHIVAEAFGKPIEVQVRTRLQHLWAELSEKASDVIELSLKYGGGPTRWSRVLSSSARLVESYEGLEKAARALEAAHHELVTAHERCQEEVEGTGAEVPESMREAMKRGLVHSARDAEQARLNRERAWKETAQLLNDIISALDTMKSQKK